MLTKKQVRLLDEIVAIEAQEARDVGAIGYMARMLVQATMPHSDPGDVPAWGRRNGHLSLVMQPGMTLSHDGKTKSVGLPYGSLPRLLLAWVSTEAVRTREPVVILGDTLSAFMSELRLVPTGGRWGTITRLRVQMMRLFSASISVTFDGDGRWSNSGLRIADDAHLWWHPQQPHQAMLWRSAVTLGSRFYDELVANPVPVDMRALQALRRSPMALDIYTWLTHRMSYLRADTLIPWPMLAMQFGADFGRLSNFRAAFSDSLRRVLLVYQAAVTPTSDGLQLRPSRTHVRRA
jgi:hypothetical protein